MFNPKLWNRAFSAHSLRQAAIISLCCGILHAYSSGPDPRYTGAPGDSSGACTSCHRGLAINAGQGSVTIVMPNGNSYTPGVTQHIMVQVSDPQQRRWGFQMSARLKSDQVNGQAGDFNPSDGFTQVICDNFTPKPCSANALVQFIEHTAAGTRSGVAGGVTFEFDWTPPAADSGNIVFYVAANAANGDGSQNGDHIYTTSLEITSSNPAVPPAPTIPATKYTQHNLVSDLPGLADQTDAALINPWGIALNPTGPFWISNNHTGTSTLYNGSGLPFPIGSPLVVNIPAAGAGNAPTPTGQVFNGTPAFEISPGNPAMFIFATETGTISGWNPQVDAGNAKLMIDRSGSGAVYKGVALGSNDSGPLLYAANFAAATIDVFDGKFQPTQVAGGFVDPNLPAGFAPFNIRRIGRKLYVAYALQNDAKHDDVAGAGNGLIDVFDSNGTLVQRLVSNGKLNSPWGIALAPDFFGDYSNTLLIGNFGDGAINAFDPFTGEYLGTLQDGNGNPISNPGLWALEFGNGHDGGDANTLYFTAGIANGANVEDHGLFGSIQVAQ
ncbi:MAG: TIGR03118 family protein [Acidobacteriia bacterium]|nr:TIGR03118 family protein [Terriglobia bacterium]